MGRPRQFDETEVLRQATALLGRRGFDSVPVDTALEATGLNRATFYKLFGSKQGLARAALEQVCERAQHGDIDQSSKDLVVVILLELAPLDPEIHHLAFKAVELCFNNDPDLIGQHLLYRANRPNE